MMPPEESNAAAPAASQEPATAPAPATTSEPTPSPSPDSASDSNLDFAGLGGDFDDDMLVDSPAEPEPAPETPPAEVEPQPAEGEQVPPKPEEAAPQADAPAGAAAEGPKEPAQPAEPSPPLEPRGLVKQINENRQAIVDNLMKSTFAWDAEEKEEFTKAMDLDPSKAISDFAPKLASRIYVESVAAALDSIEQFVPQMTMNLVKALDTQREQEEKFFKAFPALSKDKHWNDVVAFSSLARQQNPKIGADDLRAFVGAAILAKHGLTNAPAPAQPAASQRKPAAPAFVPAQNGASVSVTPEPDNPWGGLGADHDSD